MPAPTWKGYLRLSLVAVPVKAYSATATGAGPIPLHQLHDECHSRIKYNKTCPIHGEVSNDEIVSGYQYAKGKYVVIDPDELDKLRTEDDKAIKIDQFIAPDTLDRIYFTDRSYYLLPEGRVGKQPFALIRDGMEQQKRWAIAQVVLHGKEELVLLRPKGRLLLMTILDREDQVRKPSFLDDQAPKAEAPHKELEATKELIEASTAKHFHFADYKDLYKERLKQLIEAKVKGKEIVAAPPVEERHVINLMEALRQSIAETEQGGTQHEHTKPPRKMAASKRGHKTEPKRKSS
jgi:DNA end-binding protein Ku